MQMALAGRAASRMSSLKVRWLHEAYEGDQLEISTQEENKQMSFEVQKENQLICKGQVVFSNTGFEFRELIQASKWIGNGFDQSVWTSADLKFEPHAVPGMSIDSTHAPFRSAILQTENVRMNLNFLWSEEKKQITSQPSFAFPESKWVIAGASQGIGRQIYQSLKMHPGSGILLSRRPVDTAAKVWTNLQMDLTEANLPTDSFQNLQCDHFLFSALTDYRTRNFSSTDFVQKNMQMLENSLALATQSLKKNAVFILFSTEFLNSVPAVEQVDRYLELKLQQEQRVLQWSASSNFRALILRLPRTATALNAFATDSISSVEETACGVLKTLLEFQESGSKTGTLGLSSAPNPLKSPNT